MTDLDKVYEKLKLLDYFENTDELDIFIHSLEDIIESIDKIRNEYLRNIILTKDENVIKECLWDIREEFRHIDYHVKDAKLTE